MALRFKQILKAPWKGDHGLTYTLYGLTEGGRVYRFKPSAGAWLALPDVISDGDEEMYRYSDPEVW